MSFASKLNLHWQGVQVQEEEEEEEEEEESPKREMTLVWPKNCSKRTFRLHQRHFLDSLPNPESGHRKAQESTGEHERARESTGERRRAQESTGEQRRAPKER
jgi:hypothetical protein